MNQREAKNLFNQQMQDLEPNKIQTTLSPDKPKKMRLVDPAASGKAPGPKLQALIDGIGTVQRKDLNTDLLWMINAPVQTMTPEEVQELTMDDPYQVPPNVDENDGENLFAYDVGNEEVKFQAPQVAVLPTGVIAQLSGGFSGLGSMDQVEEVKEVKPKSIKEQAAWEAEDIDP